MRKKLRDAITGKRTVSYIKKPELWASVCDGCDKVFKMSQYCNDGEISHIQGTFDRCAGSKGNMFFATVCSFACAHTVFTGAWKDMEEYQPFVRAGAELVRAELRITSLVLDESQLIRKWEDSKEYKE